jgi:antibiotic biosynthesis monooxygenase (ABM) superfamily enzyme
LLRPGYFKPGGIRGQAMELVFTTIAVIGGMAFSLAVALLVEELIFGKVLGLFFVPRASEVRTER